MFRSDRDREGIGELYAMALDGSNVRRLTDGGDYWMPAWSPDGTSIAFRRVAGLDTAVGLTASDNEPVLLVTGEDSELRDRALTWSGDELWYASRQVDREIDIWVVSRSGGQHRLLFGPGAPRREEIDVSRTDGRLVFSWNPTYVPGPSAGATQDLFLANGPDDAAPENLTQGRVYVPVGPRWSPDGRSIVFWGFARAADGSLESAGDHAGGFNAPDAELYLIDVNTRELTRLTDNDVDDATPAWTPDGKYVIFSSFDGDDDIWKLSVDGSEDPVNLTENSDVPSSDSMPDCFWGAPQ